MSKFTVADLKKQLAINTHQPDMQITLCYSGKDVFVKPLKVKEKKELLKSLESKNEILVNKVLDEIIDSYVLPVDGGAFNSKDLTIQERHQILIFIRAANGEETVKIAHQCPKCEGVTKDIPYQLTKRSEVKNYESSGMEKVVTICNSAVKIYYDVVTRLEEISVEEFLKKSKLKSLSDRQFAMIAASIKKIVFEFNGETQEVSTETIDDKMKFIEELDSKEFSVITDAINKLDFGVKMPFEFTCSHCDYTSNEEVNATVFFIS